MNNQSDLPTESKKPKGSKQKIPVNLTNRFMDPPPTGLPRVAIESYLQQIDTQLDLAKILADNICFDEAMQLHVLVHNRIKELAYLGDSCLAQCTVFENEDESLPSVQKRKQWLAEAELSPESGDQTLKETHLSRWTKEEVDLFNLALEQADSSKRGYPERIHEIVKTRTVIQIRERLRKIKAEKKLKKAANC